MKPASTTKMGENRSISAIRAASKSSRLANALWSTTRVARPCALAKLKPAAPAPQTQAPEQPKPQAAAAQGVDEIIFEEYKDAIKYGALAYLMLMAEKTWSNPNMSAFYQSQFDAAITDSKMRAEKGYAHRKTFRTKAHYI